MMNKANNEIIFRIMFDGIDDSSELVITKDGEYNFVDKKKLEKDKTAYEEILVEWHFGTLKVNQKYYSQFLQMAENWLGEKPQIYTKSNGKEWAECNNEELFDFGLYQEVVWKISHDDSEVWPGSTALDRKLGLLLLSYLHYCNFLYSDDYGEYLRDEACARDQLDKMKVYIDEAYSGTVSEERFRQFFKKNRDRIMTIKFKNPDIVVYLDERKYVGRVEFEAETSEVFDKIIDGLEKESDFQRNEDYFVTKKMEEIERADKVFDYAYSLFEGEDCEQNLALAYKIFKELAENLGRADALYYLGLYYQEGYGVVEKNIDTAIKYYEKALEAGDLKYSANNLGVIYATGNGVPKDEKKALKYYEIAMKNGDAYATASVAKMYEEGRIVERNRLKALELYHEADVKTIGNDVSLEFREKLKEDIERLKEELK